VIGTVGLTGAGAGRRRSRRNAASLNMFSSYWAALMIIDGSYIYKETRFLNIAMTERGT
jgi:hypothetical protein